MTGDITLAEAITALVAEKRAVGYKYAAEARVLARFAGSAAARPAGTTICWCAANRTDGELAYYRCWLPTPVSLRTLVQVAGTRWCVETCFQTGKGLGLDEHQVRRWDSWYRHTTLVMLAHAILTVIAARERAHHRPDDTQLVPLSVNEIRRLLAKLVVNAVHTADHWLGWSRWRRRHQARAKTSHYRRRGHLEHRPAPT